MSKSFIKEKYGWDQIAKAQAQQRALTQLLESDVQEDYRSGNYNWTNFGRCRDFINEWVGATFKEDTYNNFIKNVRYPLPSSRIVKDKIIPELERVFYAENSFFNYSIKGEDQQAPDFLKSEKFKKDLFNRVMYSPNDILVYHDPEGEDNPERTFISIFDVIAIKSKDNVIKEIAYKTNIYWPDNEDGYIDGEMYMSEDSYIFYPNDEKYEEITKSHELGRCPADYISLNPFKATASNYNEDVVRRSIFSNVRELLEEYVLMNTLRKMSDPRGAIPVATTVKLNRTNGDVDMRSPVESSYGLYGQTGEEGEASDNLSATLINPPFNKSKEPDVTEAGTKISIGVKEKEDGSSDMSMVTDFIKYHYMPVPNLKRLDERIADIEKEIVISVTGDYFEPQRQAQNEIQASKSYISKQDRLRQLSTELTSAHETSDRNMLDMKYGADESIVDLFYGSDFFFETEKDIFELIETSPNPIESKYNIRRLVNNRSRFNKAQGKRDGILYSVMPYLAQKDFDLAVENNRVDIVTMDLRTNFNYWISLFEATYGDIVIYWEDTLEGMLDSEKIIEINSLLRGIIETSQQKNGTNKEQTDEASSDNEAIQAVRELE